MAPRLREIALEGRIGKGNISIPSAKELRLLDIRELRRVAIVTLPKGKESREVMILGEDEGKKVLFAADQ